MIRRVGRQMLLLATGVVVLLGLAAPVSAAPAAQNPPKRAPGGVTVSPAFQQIVVSQVENEKTFEFAVKNNTSEPLEFALSAVDFGSLDESGGVLFMGQTSKDVDYKYGLAQYVTLQQDRVVVEPKATAKVPVTITNKESLSPGGHYGAILVTPTQTEDRPTKVAVNQIITSLLFVTKKGGERYDMALQSYQLKTHLFSPPTTVDMRFQNAGNVHVIPRGMITVTDPRGRVVQQGFINEGSAIVLPESFRKLSVSLKNLHTAWWPGIYHMKMSYHFDGEETDHVKSLAFTYVNGWYIVGGMVVMALAILAILLRPVRRFFTRIGRILAWPFRRLWRLIRRRQK